MWLIDSCKWWLTFFVALLTPRVNLASDVCPPGASGSPPVLFAPAGGARVPADGVTLNSGRSPDRADRGDGGAIYTLPELLRLRAAATEAPPDGAASLLRRLGLHRRRHRGVRDGTQITSTDPDDHHKSTGPPSGGMAPSPRSRSSPPQPARPSHTGGNQDLLGDGRRSGGTESRRTTSGLHQRPVIAPQSGPGDQSAGAGKPGRTMS